MKKSLIFICWIVLNHLSIYGQNRTWIQTEINEDYGIIHDLFVQNDITLYVGTQAGLIKRGEKFNEWIAILDSKSITRIDGRDSILFLMTNRNELLMLKNLKLEKTFDLDSLGTIYSMKLRKDKLYLSSQRGMYLFKLTEGKVVKEILENLSIHVQDIFDYEIFNDFEFLLGSEYLYFRKYGSNDKWEPHSFMHKRHGRKFKLFDEKLFFSTSGEGSYYIGQDINSAQVYKSKDFEYQSNINDFYIDGSSLHVSYANLLIDNKDIVENPIDDIILDYEYIDGRYYLASFNKGLWVVENTDNRQKIIQLELIISPNPSCGEFSACLKNGDVGNYDYIIYSNSGRVIERSNFNISDKSHCLNINLNEGGSYFITVIKDGQSLIHQSFSIVK